MSSIINQQSPHTTSKHTYLVLMDFLRHKPGNFLHRNCYINSIITSLLSSHQMGDEAAGQTSHSSSGKILHKTILNTASEVFGDSFPK